MAAALSVIVWRMLRDERQRTDARVAVLATMTARTPPSPVPADLSIRPSAPVAMGAMFEERHEPSPWGQRFAVMGALGLVLASVLLFTLATTTKTSARGRASETGASPAAAIPASLELISLRDARKDGGLTITGLVRNADPASTLQRVTVTAYTFDDKGSFLASGRSLIDVTVLAPKDESPFVVTVPVSDTVSRYRIGFRAEDGRVITHIDKR
jgi:hypothetical protein